MCDGDIQCSGCAQAQARTIDDGSSPTANTGTDGGLNLWQWLIGPVKTDSQITINDNAIIKIVSGALIVVMAYFIIKKLTK